jgi:hypothetical protein
MPPPVARADVSFVQVALVLYAQVFRGECLRQQSIDFLDALFGVHSGLATAARAPAGAAIVQEWEAYDPGGSQ